MITSPPPVQSPKDWRFPLPQRAMLDSGLNVAVYELPGQQVISVVLVLDVPLTLEEADQEGVATVCARTLDEGTATHPGETFAEELENEGAAILVSQEISGLQAMMDLPTSRLARALPLFAEAITQPQLSDSDVARHVALRLNEIDQVKANSASLASMTFRNTVFSHRYRASRMTGGEAETVANVTGETVRRFHAEHYGPRFATLVLAGHFLEDPMPLVERVFGGWRNDEQLPVDHAGPGPGTVATRLIERESVQSDIRLGAYGIDRQDSRWPDFQVATYAVGGAFLSRLNKVLREQRGYTYGVGLRNSPLRVAGSFAVSGSFRHEVAKDAIGEARQLLDISISPLTRSELDSAISFYVGTAPLRYATAEGVADQSANQILHGLPDDYLNDYLARIRAVTPDSANDAYQSLVRQEALSLVVVGDVSRLR